MIRFFTLLFLLMASQSVFAKTLLILGDSLSAGYQMPIEQAWPSLLPSELESLGHDVQVVNGSISGDTTGNGLERLPNLLAEHNPDYVLIELGANDGLRGFPPNMIKGNLSKLIQMITSADAQPLVMQIHVLPNYGKRYTEAFSEIYPAISEQYKIPLIPFFLEGVIRHGGWMMSDGLHPKPEAQPWIANFVAKALNKHI